MIYSSYHLLSIIPCKNTGLKKLKLLKMFVFKNIGIFLLIVSTSLLLTSFAGRPSAIVKNNYVKQAGSVHEAGETTEPLGDEELVHERLLRANTKDYGRYDPAPTFAKPRFKLIPN